MIIIPARAQSSRFPNKVLCDIGGLPMVIRTAKNAQSVDEVLIACDDESIESACKIHKIPCVMTSPNHSSGTDRCAEAAAKLGLDDDEIVLNIQADEPFLEKGVIETLARITKEARGKGAFMASLAKRVSGSEVGNPNLVKVLLNAHSEAIYFSRFAIPYCRDKELGGAGFSPSAELARALEAMPYLGHLGLYGFSAGSLREFCALAHSPLEEIEKLEQLRALYHGKRIAMAVVETQSVGIDTPEDYKHALEKFAHLL